MNIIQEISHLPNFGYVFVGDDGRLRLAVLGGRACPTSDSYPLHQAIIRIHAEMESLYKQANLEVEDKCRLAKLMQKMQSLCQTRKVGLYTLKEQQTYIDNLSTHERLQIENQIQMYKDSRLSCKDFL